MMVLQEREEVVFTQVGDVVVRRCPCFGPICIALGTVGWTLRAQRPVRAR